ncbi:MAG: hypothetical protein E5Y63_06180 [Mesorhizobium sp.]|uniref:hypothetical protein n=1 Tax=Mesorhizobium sp. TaxID=1871066 RepID=UPI00121D205A|nr:hypothetical protein [Mesorhizobium sp.]TIM31602.1 MAG: hypothetical protein E5Y63_06180 [Mesorhizobium sp.]
MKSFSLSSVIAVGLCGLPSLAAAQVTLDPAEVIAKYAEILQVSISPDMPPDTFVSILPIGLAVDADKKYFPLANSCLRPETFPGTLGSLIRVSDVYKIALDNMARARAPSQPTAAQVAAARKFRAEHLDVYEKYRKEFSALRGQRETATSPGERDRINGEMLSVEHNWIALGYKREVEAVLATIMNSADGFIGFHADALESALGPGAGPGTSPSVELSVSRDNWDQQGGWVTVKFEDTYNSRTEQTEIKQRRGSGGFSAGFFKIGGGGSSTSITESIVTDVRNLRIELDLKLVMIERPWMNSSVFFEPQTWGWKAITGVAGAPPHISQGLTQGQYVEPMEEQKYSGSRVDCQLIPTSFLLAKRRRLIATVSKDSYNRILRESAAGGSASFFGFSLGGSGSDKFEKITETDQTVEFSITSLDWKDNPPDTVDVNDVVILGTISRVVPLGPIPANDLTYEDGLWRSGN